MFPVTMRITMRINTKIYKTLLIALLLQFSASHALPEDSTQPINITADEAQYNQQTGEGVYNKNVLIKQGSLEIKADNAIFYMENGELSYVKAKGNLIHIQYLPEKDKPWVYGEGQNLEYYPKKNELILMNNAKITQDKDIVTANKIIYDTASKKITAKGRSNHDRVNFTIQPKQ